MKAALLNAGRRRLPVVHFVVDSVIWLLVLPLAVWLRYDYDWSTLTRNLLVPMAAAVGLQGLFGCASGLYRRRWRYGTFDELLAVGANAAAVGVVLSAANWSLRDVPRSVPALAMGLALLGQIAVRSAWRLYKERLRPVPDDVSRLVVIGAGDGGERILRSLRAASDSRYVAVALLDDDPAKRNLRLSGIRVEGPVADLERVATRHHADGVLIAVPSADSVFVRAVTDVADRLKMSVFILPTVDELIAGTVDEADIRPVTDEDLLGRHTADIDTAAVAGYVTGKRVLVTGAGGSIGSELCRQLAKFAPAKLYMLDRDESGLHSTQLSIEGKAMLDDDGLLLADIRDADRVDELFATVRPEVVFHAAALKHLPLLEMHPAEGWKTNVWGTLNVLRAAQTHGTERFVNISTDKAADAQSVLGWTKRITERLTAHFSQVGTTECVSVRFGNVLGSNGSVLRAFRTQAAQGLPLTVTDPEVTRYFMTIEEASRLVVYAGAIGDPGEVLILDMGEPVRIMDVAQRFAAQHNPPLEIVITGLRPNEKLHEDLISHDEFGERRVHKLITHVPVPPLDPATVVDRAPVSDDHTMSTIAASSADSAFVAG